MVIIKQLELRFLLPVKFNFMQT